MIAQSDVGFLADRIAEEMRHLGYRPSATHQKIRLHTNASRMKDGLPLRNGERHGRSPSEIRYLFAQRCSEHLQVRRPSTTRTSFCAYCRTKRAFDTRPFRHSNPKSAVGAGRHCCRHVSRDTAADGPQPDSAQTQTRKVKRYVPRTNFLRRLETLHHCEMRHSANAGLCRRTPCRTQ